MAYTQRMRRARQLDLFTATERPGLREHASRVDHGGDIRKGKRKLARPLDPKRPMHVVMRASRAMGEWSMLRSSHEARVRDIVYRAARRNQVRIYQYANAGNHLHLLVKGKTRESFQNFARTVGALVARAVTGARKGKPVGKFWDALLYSRMVEWGKAFFNARYYVIRNELEGLGWSDILPPRPRRGHPPPDREAR